MLRNRTCPSLDSSRHAPAPCPQLPVRPVPRPLGRPSLPVGPAFFQPLAPAAPVQQLCSSTRHPLLPPVSATANGATTSVAPPPSSPSHISFDPQQRARSRKDRLSKLLELRSIYRNYVRAKTLLDLPSPVYRPAEEHEEGPPAVQGEPSQEMDPQRMSYEEFQEQERLKEAVDAVAEMMLVAEQIKIGLRTLPAGFGEVITADGQPSTVDEAENLVRTRGKEFVQQLQARVAEEMPKLPFGSETAAQTALDTQKARSIKQAQQMGDFEAFQLSAPEVSPAAGDKDSEKAAKAGESEGSSEKDKGSASTGGLVLPGQDAALQLERGIEQLAQAEKVAGKFVATRLKPVLRKAQNAEVGDIVRGTGSYLSGLWTRLNGRGSNVREPALSPDLPLPKSNSAKDSELVISQLSLDLDDLAKRLREAGRTRENKLKQAKAPEGRVTMPFLLKSMDEEVLRLSRELALRTLQLEMEYAYRALEDEAMDLVGFDVKDVMNRQGSTAELRLLAAEFAYLDEQLAGLASQASGGVPTVSVSTVDANGNAISGDGRGSMSSSSLVMEDLLASLANDIPDMRQRVGVPDQVVFGGQGFSFTKTRLQIQEAFEAVLEAVMFLVRGLKLLTSDVTNSGRRFWRAAMGATLKPREVSALKRTARDLLAFIPFTIILIIPITPLGHVLVFGFIQQYFPQFFPSCFTTKRQEIMVRYEELERQLLAARAQAEAAEEEAELAQAAAAVARLTAPENAGTSAAPAGAAAGSGSTQAAGSGKGGTAWGKSNGAGRQSGGVASQQQQSGQPTQQPQPQAAQQQPQVQQSRQPQQQQHQQHSMQGDAANGNGRASAASVSVDDATNEVVAQTAQVRALEQQVAAMYDDVTLGDMDGAELTEVKQKEKSNSLRKRSSRKNNS